MTRALDVSPVAGRSSGFARPLLICALVALALRVAWVLMRWQQGGAAFEFDDEKLHWQLAANLAQHGALVSDDGRYAARMPFYPAFLALFAGLGERGVLAARLAQALLGAVAVAVGAGWAAREFGRRAAWVAGLLLALDPYQIFFANLLLSEVPFTLVFVALVALAASPTSRARGWFALLGPTAVMVRPSAAGVVALLWLWQAVALWRGSAESGRTAGRLRLVGGAVALNLAATLIMFLPWGWRNQQVLGAPAWLSANGGVTLYDAQGPQADGRSNQDFMRALPELAGLNEVQQDQRLRDLAMAQMRADPARVLRLAWVKFIRMWSFIPNYSEYRGGATGLVSAGYTGGVLLLAVIALFRSRVYAGVHARLWLPVVYFTLLHCIYIGSLRYRIPLMPFLAIGAAGLFAARAQPPAACDLSEAKR